MLMNRRSLITSLGAAVGGSQFVGAAPVRPRNFVVILCDDLGYGDLGSYGSPIRTPELDRMAREGTRFTNAISVNPVCSPSRAGLLTGRYPARVGIPKVLLPPDKGGLAKDEITLAELLKKKGYATGCIGKWHIGHQADQMPLRRGFDSYFGIPYSNDLKPTLVYEDEKVVEQDADQESLTRRYTERAVQFIEKNSKQPFFLYLAHTYPHIPLHASSPFSGKSEAGIYGDVVSELDWSTGRILETLRKQGLARDTMVVFTSDNGPWYQGSPGATRGRKGATWEGGVRVPFLAWQPGSIPASRTSKALVSLMDLFPTAAASAGLEPPKPTDGIDAWPVLSGRQESLKREDLLYFLDTHMQCIRRNDWKLHLSRYNGWLFSPETSIRLKNLPLPKPELYNLAFDPEESYDISERHPELVRDLMAKAEAMIAGFPQVYRDSFAATRKIPVMNTPAGQYPIARPTE